ncbi:hypothetical protein JK358_23020 [Nocardia sp. 2]|uniref:Secreted protein n=1 Tax=Nocardia acididurans TaxID=2802282 RepID=A0ABS1M9I1_9NOCA|nr:HAD domain-containing protein [Nocardia acididurans]MBL1077277.1 hypothetical protein [Nocardia acididurans]
MTPSTLRPLLFLDVDGPLLPFGGPNAKTVDPHLGPLLRALPCELVWATTWMDEANLHLTPILGLPTLPVMQWPDTPDDGIDAWFGLHWKTRALVDRAAGGAFVWVDDEIRDSDREWVAANHGGRALLHRVDPRIGLRVADFEVIRAWLG